MTESNDQTLEVSMTELLKELLIDSKRLRRDRTRLAGEKASILKDMANMSRKINEVQAERDTLFALLDALDMMISIPSEVHNSPEWVCFKRVGQSIKAREEANAQRKAKIEAEVVA